LSKKRKRNRVITKAAARSSLSILKEKVSMKGQVPEKKSLIRDKLLRIMIYLLECLRKTGKIVTEAKTCKIMIQNLF